uniref:Uncharacterized protein n=1 Tax=Rangifer tarandus platyrhynchus TaxID=3082113 RepID=A0ACB0FGS3_RANTA|nr:unnamed protein product [Rangifer tarandus platyrhynchus]
MFNTLLLLPSSWRVPLLASSFFSGFRAAAVGTCLHCQLVPAGGARTGTRSGYTVAATPNIQADPNVPAAFSIGSVPVPHPGPRGPQARDWEGEEEEASPLLTTGPTGHPPPRRGKRQQRAAHAAGAKARGPSVSAHKRGEQEGRGTRHFSRDRGPGRRPQSRAAGAAVAEAVAAACRCSPGRFISEPAPGLQVRRRNVARPGLRKRGVPAEAEQGLRPRPVRPFPQRFGLGRGRGRGLGDRRAAGRTSAECRGRPRSGLCRLAVAPGPRGLGEQCPSGAPWGGGGGGPGGAGETPARLSIDVIVA